MNIKHRKSNEQHNRLNGEDVDIVDLVLRTSTHALLPAGRSYFLIGNNIVGQDVRGALR